MLANDRLGFATKAYANQNFPNEEYGAVFGDGRGVHVLDWTHDSTEPTLDQLQEALWKGDWSEVRIHRNELLAATDFYALTDVTISSDMATYRQALRDLPASVENSEDVVWPEKPS
jgi:hypothetical protein